MKHISNPIPHGCTPAFITTRAYLALKRKRHGLLRMVSDCENKKIDLIVTKSISRFARNTADCLELVRKLLNIGVFVYFENENINTGSMESELMLSILSGLAEGESVSISKNNKWALKRRFQNGLFKYHMRHTATMF